MPTDAIEKLKIRQQQLQERIKKMEATNATQQRKQENRRKFLVGEYFLNEMRQSGKEEELKQMLDKFLAKNIDRKLFGLDPIE